MTSPEKTPEFNSTDFCAHLRRKATTADPGDAADFTQAADLLASHHAAANELGYENFDAMIEGLWREGWAACLGTVNDDVAFEITDDVQQDAWQDSEAYAATNQQERYMTFIACGKCGKKVAVTDLNYHADECLRTVLAENNGRLLPTQKEKAMPDRETLCADARCLHRIQHVQGTAGCLYERPINEVTRVTAWLYRREGGIDFDLLPAAKQEEWHKQAREVIALAMRSAVVTHPAKDEEERDAPLTIEDYRRLNDLIYPRPKGEEVTNNPPVSRKVPKP